MRRKDYPCGIETSNYGCCDYCSETYKKEGWSCCKRR